MNDFLTQYGVCIILCLLGGLLVMVTYASFFIKPSGVPFVGGILIALGFLTTPHKWLALFGLVDPGWLMIVMMIIENRQFKKVREDFEGIIEAGYMAASDLPEEVLRGEMLQNPGRQEKDPHENGAEEASPQGGKVVTRLFVSIPDRDETLEWGYHINSVYRLRYPKGFFCICIDRKGKRYLLIDTASGSQCIEAMAFDRDSITIKGFKDRKKEMTVILDVKQVTE